MYTLFVTCTRYLEPLLKHELEVLGASDVKQTVAGCRATGNVSTAYRLCMWSRVGSRVLLQLHEFEFTHEDEIYTGAAEVPWDEIFPLSSTFAIDANVSKSRVKNANYAALKVKDAVVDSFRKSNGQRPNVNAENPDVRFHLHTEKQSAVVYLDLSGDSLHRRGYRLSGTQAPLRETSAAGMLLKAGWPEIAAKGGALIDPMCGSGTLPIEAALIAGNIAPGLLRNRFGFEFWKDHEVETWNAVRAEAEAARETGLLQIPPIYGSDKSRKAMDAAAENIKRAGLSDKIQLKTQPFEHLEVPLQAATPGLIVTNPPYGVRMQKREEVDLLYSQFGKWIKAHFPNYIAAILAPDKAAAKQLGLRADRINTIYNGNLKIVLVRITLDDANSFVPPENTAGSPAFIQGTLPVQNEDQSSGVNMLVNRILKNKRQLKKYLKKNGISCYRIYDADIPQYAAAVDVYEDRYAVVQEYAPPSEIEPEAAEQRLQELLAAIPQCFEIDKGSIFLKQRKRQKGSSQYSKMNAEHEFFIVKEGELKFYVNFTDYLDRGLFLAHRLTRSIIREKSDQSKFLNLFAYTSTASVYAAVGGAVKTVSVDTSTTYLEWGKKNFALNHYISDSHLFIRRDVFEFLSSDFENYDLIFVDPPTFSNRKSEENVFAVQRDHFRLLTLAAEHLKPSGEIIFSNNYRRFQLDPALYDLFDIKEISQDTLPQDFSRNKKIHRTWLLRFPG